MQEKIWSEGLTGDLGVGVGELATDDDLVRLRPVELAAGFVPLAEEVAVEALSAFIQGLEVGKELDVDVPVENQKLVRCRRKEDWGFLGLKK